MRRREARRAMLGAALLGCLCLPALAEEEAALMARSPALALDAPVVALGAPVELGGAGWGPFRRLCVTRMMLRPSDGQEFATSPPSCFEVEQAREDGSLWRLSLRTDPIGGGSPLAFATTRDAAGAVGEVEIAVPEGVARPSPQQLARLQAVFRAAVQANGMPRTVVAPEAEFLMPLPLDAVDPDLRMERDGLVCRPEGEAAAAGRRVLVAACAGRGSGEMSPGRMMRIAIAGRFAVDVATGMVLRHGYASWVAIDADPRGGMGRIEMRGVSRQSLQ